MTIGPAASPDNRAARLEFIEVRDQGEALEPGASQAPGIPGASQAPGVPGPIVPGPIVPTVEAGWNLWGDPDR